MAGYQSIMPEEARSSVEARHKNALGYTIQAAGSRSEAGASIMVGKSETGALVSIESIPHGGRCNLRCECGAPLVAKKGDERAHHFAHEAGSTSECAVARDAALGRFSMRVLSSGNLRLPETVHRTKQPDVAAEGFDVCNGTVRICVRYKEARFYVYMVTKAKHGRSIRQRHLSPDFYPAFLIDLTKFRDLSDNEISEAICFSAPRHWTYNRSQRDLDLALFTAMPTPSRDPLGKEARQPYVPGSNARRSAASFEKAVAESLYLAEIAASRLQAAIRLYEQHRPEEASAFADTPLTCLNEMTPAQYNERFSDLVPKIERHLGLRDAAGRPINL